MKNKNPGPTPYKNLDPEFLV